ncbi:hypothetical protein JCM11251_000819 [Rhodosporidiobolus azoricus]
MTAPEGVDAPLFRIGPTSNGWLGAFAATDISRGTLVLDDKPLFTLDAPLQAYLFSRAQSGASGGPTPAEGEDEDEEPPKTLEEFLDKTIRTMLGWKTEGQRQEFWELANTRPELPPAYGIFTTNAVQTRDETGGLFLHLSRFNSSCRPTLSRPSWDSSSGSTKLYALRDISTGEELTWTYLNVTFEFEGRDARRSEMERVFEFVCACEACRDFGEEVEGEEREQIEEKRRKSEKRLMQLRRLKERIDWTADVGGKREGEDVQARRTTLRRMADLSREEGLWETAERLERSADPVDDKTTEP